jgi:hypothetical protein
MNQKCAAKGAQKPGARGARASPSLVGNTSESLTWSNTGFADPTAAFAVLGCLLAVVAVAAVAVVRGRKAAPYLLPLLTTEIEASDAISIGILNFAEL